MENPIILDRFKVDGVEYIVTEHPAHNYCKDISHAKVSIAGSSLIGPLAPPIHHNTKKAEALRKQYRGRKKFPRRAIKSMNRSLRTAFKKKGCVDETI